MKELTVNDGKGFWDSDGLIDTLVTDLNNLMKYMASGQYILFANDVVQISQKLASLKKGIREDRKSLEAKIEDLQRLNNELAEKAFGMPVNREGGAEDGQADRPGETEGV